MDHSTPYRRFSSDVRIELRIEGSTFAVAAAGPEDLILRNAMELAPCDAEVVMFVDGEGFILPVRLGNGAVPFEKRVSITHRGMMTRLQPLVEAN